MRSVALDAFSLTSTDPGTREQMWLDALPGLLQPVRLPSLIARGRQDGPTLLAIAGVHGDEYEGMEAIRLFFATLDPLVMRGSFIGIPVANPFAYEARARVAPLSVDGLNLARVFPGDALTSTSRALARAILDFVLKTLTADDLLIDFHSGSADVAFSPLIGFRDIPGEARTKSEAAARRFGIPNLWCIPDSVGPLNAETTRCGIPTIGTETSGRAGCLPEDVAQYIEGLQRMMGYLQIIDGLQSAPLSRPARKTINLMAPTTGFLRLKRTLHDDIAAGDEIGVIVDPLGSAIETVRAPVAGTIWAARSMPPVRVGEQMFMIATNGEQPS